MFVHFALRYLVGIRGGHELCEELFVEHVEERGLDSEAGCGGPGLGALARSSHPPAPAVHVTDS